MYYVEIFSTAFYFNNLEVHMYSASQSGKVLFYFFNKCICLKFLQLSIYYSQLNFSSCTDQNTGGTSARLPHFTASLKHSAEQVILEGKIIDTKIDLAFIQ